MSRSLEDELPQLLAEVGLSLLRSGSFDKAETVIRGLVELRPAEPASHLLAGMLAFARERFAEAEKSYRKVIEVTPGDGLGRAFLAESLIAQKRWREAEELAGAVARAGGDSAAARFAADLAQGLRQGLFQQAAQA